MTAGRRELTAAVLGAVGAGALALVAGGQAWAQVTVQREAPLPPVTDALSGAEAAPLGPAAGLVLLAAAVALLAVRGPGRAVVGLLMAVAGGQAWAQVTAQREAPLPPVTGVLSGAAAAPLVPAAGGRSARTSPRRGLSWRWQQECSASPPASSLCSGAGAGPRWDGATSAPAPRLLRRGVRRPTRTVHKPRGRHSTAVRTRPTRRRQATAPSGTHRGR